MFMDRNMNPKCQECGTVDIDFTFKKVFGCLVCNRCKNEKPERYSLLTKTECKTVSFCHFETLTFPLTFHIGLSPDGSCVHETSALLAATHTSPIAELRDQELMPHLLKANPHKSTFANMMLFLRYQVEEFAWKKWGSPEALDAEWERREAEKKKKKNKKFEDGLKELRRRTRETVWQRRKDAEHKHVFGVVEKGENGEGKQICHECGFTIDVEEF